MNDLSADKKFLRAQCLAAREKIDDAQAAAAAKEIAQYFLEIIPASAKIVAGYFAIRKEIDVALAFSALAARGHALCFPVVEHKNAPLVFHRWLPGEKLTKGSYGIDVPAAGEPVVPDAMMVPLAAFDKTGHRLGYGSGYYDQTIGYLRQTKKNVQIIGAAYSSQQIGHIPAESYDEKLDAVVTEKGIIRFT